MGTGGMGSIDWLGIDSQVMDSCECILNLRVP